MNCYEVYKESEPYRIGWTHGFYGCAPDQGALYGGKTRFRLWDSTDRIDSAHDYARGYIDGTTAWLSAHITGLQGAGNTKSQLDEKTTAARAA